jgi:hypothetical protein
MAASLQTGESQVLHNLAMSIKKSDPIHRRACSLPLQHLGYSCNILENLKGLNNGIS